MRESIIVSNEYYFITHWRVEAIREEVYRLLSNAPDLVRWWPSVYLDVKEIEPGDKNGLGKTIRLHTAWLAAVHVALAVPCNRSELS